MGKGSRCTHRNEGFAAESKRFSRQNALSAMVDVCTSFPRAAAPSRRVPAPGKGSQQA